MTAIPLIIPKAPVEWIEENDPYFYERLKDLSLKEKQKHREEVNLMFDHSQCKGDNPLFCRICTICKLEFPTAHQAHNHYSTFEHKLERARQKGLPLPVNPLFCKVCDKLFASKRNFTKHLKTKLHIEKLSTPTFFCSICQSYFKNRAQLNKHRRTNKKHLKNIQTQPLKKIKILRIYLLGNIL